MEITRKTFLGGLVGLALTPMGCSVLNKNPNLEKYPIIIITTPPKNSMLSKILRKNEFTEEIHLKLLDYKLGEKLQGEVMIGTWEETNRQGYVEMLDYPEEFTDFHSKEIPLTNEMVSFYINMQNYKESDALTTILTNETGNSNRLDYPVFGIEPHPLLTPDRKWAHICFGYEKPITGKKTFEIYRKCKDEPDSKINPELESKPDLKIVYELIKP